MILLLLLFGGPYQFEVFSISQSWVDAPIFQANVLS